MVGLKSLLHKKSGCRVDSSFPFHPYESECDERHYRTDQKPENNIQQKGCRREPKRGIKVKYVTHLRIPSPPKREAVPSFCCS
jgi:hypothetical protein